MLLLAINLSSCKPKKSTEKHTYTISGEIKGLTHDFLFRIPNKPPGYPLKKIHVEGGKFTFTDTIKELTLLKLRTKDTTLYKKTSQGQYFSKNSMGVMVFAYPGANIKITGEVTDYFNAYPSGDKFNNSLAEINKIISPNTNTYLNLIIESSYEKDSIRKATLDKKANNILALGENERLVYMNNTPNSLGVLWYLNDMLTHRKITDEKAITIFNNASENLAETNIYKELKVRINGIAKTKEGNIVPDIKTNSTVDGAAFDITTLRGKYVLIDFWGIWCGPCVAEMPKVKKYQEKYKDKLVVIGVDSGDGKEAIQKFITEKGFTWRHLISAKGNTSDNFVNRFNVKGFPTKFIIDPEGKIIKRYLGSGEEAFALLDKLLK